MSATLDFLNIILPPENDYWYVGATFSGGKCHHHWHRTRLALAARLSEDSADGQEVYHACSVFSERAGGRKAANSAGLGSLFTDIDAGEGKQYATASDALDAMVEFAASVRLPAPLVVCSGFGVHCYWPLGVLLDPETWKRYSRGLADLLRRAGIKHERTTDAASLLRPVATYNRKRPNIVPVRIMVQPGEVPYQLGQLEGLLDDRGSNTKVRYFVTAGNDAVRGNSIADRLASIGLSAPRFSNRVIAGCKQIHDPYLDGRGYVPEPLWHAVLGVFSFIEGDGDDAAHQWSSDDDRYDAAQTQERLERIRASTSGATTCATFEGINPKTCKACPQFGKINSPIALCTLKKTPEARPSLDNVGENLPALPENFAWRGSKLCMVHENNKGDEIEAVISEHPIYLSDVRTRENRNGYSYHFRQHIPRTGWHDIVVPASALFNAGGRGVLHDSGANICDFGNFLKYVPAAVAMHYTNRNEIGMLYEQFGWKNNDTEFLFGEELYTPTEVRKAVIEKALASRVGHREVCVGPVPGGSLDTWRNAANSLFAGGTETQSLAICASFGSVFQRFLARDEGGSILSLVTHEGGRGKTTALAGAISVWGKKVGLSLENIDSEISKGAALGAFGNLPVFFDQFFTVDPVIVQSFVDMFTNGRDKRRMGRDGKVADPGNEWQTTLICASNASLVDSIISGGNKALASRIFEMPVDVPQHLRELFHGETLKNVLRENSGHAGAAFLSKLMAGTNLVTAKNEIARWEKVIWKESKLPTTGRYWVRLGATSAVAAEIVAGSILAFSPQRIMDWFMSEIKSRVELEEKTREDGEWTIDFIGRFFVAATQNQLVVDAPYSPHQPNYVKHKPTRELFIRKEERGGRIYIAKEALRRWCVKNGVNMSELINGLFAVGACVDRNKSVTLGAGTEYSNVRVSCICLDGYHEKIGGKSSQGNATILSFDRNNDNSLGGMEETF